MSNNSERRRRKAAYSAWYSRPDPFYNQQPPVSKEDAYAVLSDHVIADQTAPGNKTISVNLYDQVSKVWSDGAVLAGMVDAKGSSQGKEFTFRGRFVDVWAKRNGQWQVIFTQIHPVK